MLAENAKFNASWCRFAEEQTPNLFRCLFPVVSALFLAGRIEN